MTDNVAPMLTPQVFVRSYAALAAVECHLIRAHVPESPPLKRKIAPPGASM